MYFPQVKRISRNCIAFKVNFPTYKYNEIIFIKHFVLIYFRRQSNVVTFFRLYLLKMIGNSKVFFIDLLYNRISDNLIFI